MFGLSVPQAAATLAVTFVGLEIGLFDETVVNAVIVMILVTGLVGRRWSSATARKVALHEEQAPYDPAGTAPDPHPHLQPGHRRGLLDIAFMLRGNPLRRAHLPA
jgi:hypothetical protein